MKKALITVLVFGILGGGGYGAYRYFIADTKASESGRVSSDSEDAIYVDLVSAITGYGSGNGLIERYGGEVEPQATLEVKLEGDRKVEECFVKEGDEVKEGQRLFSYDTQEDETKLAQAEIEIERAEGEIEISEKSIEQNEKDRKNAGADEQLTYTTYILQEQNNIKQKEYEIKTKQLEIEQLKANISESIVTAEMGGIIQKINESGSSEAYSSYGSDESSAYITILGAGDFRIKGSINEQNLNSGMIWEGMEMLVFSRVNDGKVWSGVISEIKTDNKEEENNNYYYYGDSAGSSNYSFYVDLESSDGLILGQHVYMEENVGQNERKDGLWLEEYYIMQEGDQSCVWAAGSDNTIEKRAVVLGAFDEELQKYEITEGLTVEDYIAYPSDDIIEGTPVVYNDFSSAHINEEIFDGEGYYDGEGADEVGIEDGFWDLDEEYSGEDFYDMDEEYSDEDYYDIDEEYSDEDFFEDDAEFYAEDEESYYGEGEGTAF